MNGAIPPVQQYVFTECAGITSRYIMANHNNSSFGCLVVFVAQLSAESEELTIILKENSLHVTAKGTKKRHLVIFSDSDMQKKKRNHLLRTFDSS
jgi:hypothetical protein